MKMKTYGIFLTTITCVFALTQSVPVEVEFTKFKQKYNKSYQPAEEDQRYQAFRQNLNKLSSIKDRYATYGVTKFTDLTESEFRSKYLKLKPNVNLLRTVGKVFGTLGSFLGGILSKKRAIASSFDWRSYNVVTPVRDQGDCGACYAFSALGVLESQYAKKKKQLIDLSEQQIINCDFYDMGCSGGDMYTAFEYLKQDNGALYESQLPYDVSSSSCPNAVLTGPLRVVSQEILDTTDEDDIARELVSYGPLSHAINGLVLQNYTGGVITVACEPELNHATLIIGYGSSDGVSYWIMKNSWGSDWGENGFYRIQRGVGLCGLNIYVLTAQIK
jgi:C1A family cysteine protease